VRHSTTHALKLPTCREGKTTTLIFAAPTKSCARFENVMKREKSEPRGAVAGSVACS
jgi:hypothetical protein